jgi:hypothetical protein
MVLARININEYTNKVLNVIKAKFELKDKSEALNKFAELFGTHFAEPEVNEEYIKRLVLIQKRDKSRYKNKSMDDNEFNKLFELD